MATNFFFQNQLENKTTLKKLIYNTFLHFGEKKSKKLADKIKKLGFEFGTKSGLSLNIEDLKILPSKKNEISETRKKLAFIDNEFNHGNITFVSRLEQIINIWNLTSENLKDALIDYFNSSDPFNSINIIAFSGARGNISQVRQLVGMRGLMSTPSGNLIDVPIIHNFREGLSISDYLMSSYGARKGVVDTALRTADSGYLTRRLVEVAHDFVIREIDCLTKKAIKINLTEKNFKKVIGRCLARDIYCKKNKEFFAKKQEILTPKILLNLINNNINEIYVYSPLLCESSRSICQKCYGWDLSKCQKISLGSTVGIIAAQSIGEPGTQLTMRTFHTGGIFLSELGNQIKSEYSGIIRIQPNLNIINKRLSDGKIIKILQNNSQFSIINLKNIALHFSIPANSYIYFKNNQFIKKNTVISEIINPLIQTKKIIKNVITSNSGELCYNYKTNILELLKGDIFEIQKKLFFDFTKLKYKNTFSQKNSFPISFLKTTLVPSLPGFLQYNLLKNYLNCYRFENNFILKPTEILYLEKDRNKLKEIIFKNSPLSYEKIYINKNIFESALSLEYFHFKYYLPFDAEFAFIENEILDQNFGVNSNKINGNKVGLILPRNTERDKIIKNKQIYLNLIDKFSESFITNDKTFKENIFFTSGFKKLINNHKKKLHSKKLNEKCTQIYFIKKNKFKNKELNILKKRFKIENNQDYRSFIGFKGTTFFKKIKFSHLSLCEILLTNSYLICLITKISLYNINIKDGVSKKLNSTISFNLNVNFLLKMTNELNFLKKRQFLVIKKREIKTDTKSLLSITKYNFKTGVQSKMSLLLCLKCLKYEKLAKKLKTEKNEIINYNNVNKPYRYSHLNTKTGIINVNTKISFLNKLNLDTNKFLNLNLKYCKNYYNEFPILKKNKTKIISLIKNIKFTGVFKLVQFSTFSILARETVYYKITRGTQLLMKTGFIFKNTLLGNMSYEKRITGDIIQGLPKIEEILEARQPANSSLLAEVNGLVLNCYTKINKSKIKYELNVLTESGKLEKFLLNSKINIKNNEFIFIGKRLNNGNINLHNLINVYFQHFKNFVKPIESANLAFVFIQIIIIKKIQEIFENQNIFISDKHIELIIKKITSKVQLENNSMSLYLPDSIVELVDVQYINIILENNKKDLLIYNPIILGITKISLLNKSFIAAASFQETQKTLKMSALQNRVDWMTEIKSNILIGRTQNFGSSKQKGLML